MHKQDIYHLVGTTLKGRYNLEEFIDEGGMSIVYRGRDLDNKSVVAVKILGANLNNFGATPRGSTDNTSTLKAGKVYAFPMYPRAVGEKYPFTSMLFGGVYDFPTDFSTVSLSMYGAAKTYKPMGLFSGDAPGVGSNTIGLLMRSE